MSHNSTINMYSFTDALQTKTNTWINVYQDGQNEGLWDKQLTTVQFIEADKTIYHERIQICPAIIHHHNHQHRRLSTSSAML